MGHWLGLDLVFAIVLLPLAAVAAALAVAVEAQ